MKFIDLGLPSGTLWAKEDLILNENPLIEFSEINPSIHLPSIEQFKELIQFCKFSIIPSTDHSVYKFLGPNKNYILFIGNGYSYSELTGQAIGPIDTDDAYYWGKSTRDDNNCTLCLHPDCRKSTDWFSTKTYAHSVKFVNGSGKFLTIF